MRKHTWVYGKMAAKAPPPVKNGCPKLTLKCSIDFDATKRDIYVLCVTGTNKELEGRIAASGSNSCINVYANRGSGLEVVNQIAPAGGDGVISGLDWVDKQLCASSTNGSLSFWDTRKSSKTPTSSFQGYSQEPLNCVSSNDRGSLVAAGTDLVEEDASIYIWDLRMGRDPHGQFTDSHSNDVVEVKFKPGCDHSLLSGSTDGLVCLYDLHTMEEEEALVSVKNSDSSVSKLGHCSPDQRFVYCLTHEEGFVLWEDSEVEPVCVQRDVKKTVEDKYGVGVDYLVDCHYHHSSDKLFLIAGDNSGGLRLLHCEEMKHLVPVSLLSGGHSATVRALYWESQVDRDVVVTGGEDGQLCLWTT